MEKRYVLFSPIGMTDPIKGHKDGPLLHIIRYYHPEVAVLFMTEAIVNIHRQDNRYCRTVKAIQPDIKLDVRETSISKVYKFEACDYQFRQELVKLQERYPDHEILVNLSSGTPQMQASLYLLSATLPFPVTLLQVTTPRRGPNDKGTDFSTVEEELKTLQETGTDEDCRIPDPIHPENLQAAMKKENIKKLLEHYDYTAALAILRSAPRLFTDEARNLCEAAVLRRELQTELAYDNAKNAKHTEVFSISDPDLRPAYEYILILDILLKQKAYGDFARAVSPAITAVMEPVTSRCLGYSVQDLLCKRDAKGVWHIQPELVQAKDENLYLYMNACYCNHFRPGPLSADNLLNMLRYYHNTMNPNFVLYDFEDLREFESNVRNLAAHTIVAITEEKIIKDCGKPPHEYLTLLCRQFDMLCPSRPTWKDYDRMNDALIEALDRK